MNKRPINVILNGGLGNQLFQWAFGMSLSLNTGRNLILNTNLGAPRLSNDGEPEIATITNDLYPIRTGEMFVPDVFRRLANLQMRMGAEERKLICETLGLMNSFLFTFRGKERFKVQAGSGLGYFQLPYREKDIYVGYFQSCHWAQTVKEIMMKSRPRNGQGVEEWSSLALKERPLSIHVRLTDYRNERFGIPGFTYYKKALEEQLKKDHLYGSIWLFSDEPEEALALAQEWHSPLPIRVITEPRRESIYTLEIMRLCKGYVNANSSFSWWGSFLSYSENPRVIAPTPWFRYGKSPKELFPSGWTRLSAYEEDSL